MCVDANLDEIILIAAGNPQQGQKRVCFLRMRNKQLWRFGVWSRREGTDPGEMVEIAESDVQGLASPMDKPAMALLPLAVSVG